MTLFECQLRESDVTVCGSYQVQLVPCKAFYALTIDGGSWDGRENGDGALVDFDEFWERIWMDGKSSDSC